MRRPHHCCDYHNANGRNPSRYAGYRPGWLSRRRTRGLPPWDMGAGVGAGVAVVGIVLGWAWWDELRVIGRLGVERTEGLGTGETPAAPARRCVEDKA